MPTTEDDFGKPSPRLTRGRGTCRPRDSIGATLVDVRPQPEPRPREHELSRSCLATGPVYCAEPPSSERALRTVPARRAVLDRTGQPHSCGRPSSESRARPRGQRHVDFDPTPRKHPLHGAKRCFDWTQRPTGYENPVQYEDPPVPGTRPSHPVSACGVVALEHKRIFPELQHQPTGIPPPAMCVAPHGAEWGGWAADGSPGRRVLRGPWDSLQPKQPGRDVEVRFSDARVKRFPEYSDADTSHLTRWHLDRQRDVDPRPPNRQHLNCPMAASPLATAAAGALSESSGAASARGPPSGAASPLRTAFAGWPTGIPVEGGALQWYDRVRGAEIAAPASAR